MPARIKITRGVNAGTTHEIHVNFLRVGSDLSCDFCVPSADVPPVAILLEYVDATRSYSIHCRSKDACYFNGRLMNSGDKRDWAAGQELAIGRTVGIELELDDDPSPTPPDARRGRQQRFIDSRIQDSESEENALTTESTADKAALSALIQIGIIVFCVLASALALMFKFGAFDSFAGREDEPVPTPDLVRLELIEIAKTDSSKEVYLRLFDQAQRNRTLEKENYSKLYDMILTNEDKELCDKTYRYLIDRLKGNIVRK